MASEIPNLPPPPISNDTKDPSYRDWFYKIHQYITQPINLDNVFGILAVINGGTGTDEIPENGELLIGDGTGYVVNTLTAGPNIIITNGAGSITIESTGGGGSSKIYEPMVIAGFNNNVAYAETEPLVPNFVTTIDGDIMMAWGGEYAT